jgi:glycosyltransferase involved in cell wall biosynthesis
MTQFKLVINCGPCEPFIQQCLHSVRSQTYTAWEAHVTVDACMDNTLSQAIRAGGHDPRITIAHNSVRRYVTHNLVAAIRHSDAAPEDVIVILDGDDWFATDHALQIIVDAYKSPDCWMTYGSWISNVMGKNGKYGGLWPPYPPETTDFRHNRWLGTAVRTWKKWLWDHINDRDLRDDSGEYLRVSEDQAVMLPLLEMAGTARARHIAAPLMVYNKTTHYATARTMGGEIVRNSHLLESRPSYRRLREKTYKLALPTPGRIMAAGDQC